MLRTTPLELYVARHGEYNRAVRNGPLTPLGRDKAQARAADFAAKLAEKSPTENHATTILYAPAERTTITAEIFAEALGVTHDRMARLPILDEYIREKICPTREQLLDSICNFIGPNVTRTLVVAHLGEVSDLAELDIDLAYNTCLIEPGYAEVYPVRLDDSTPQF